jgi:hypothetical protein
MMSDLSVVQALFDAEPMAAAMNWPVDVERFVNAARELRALCSDVASSPEEIAQQWRKMTAALGVDVTASLLEERGEWQKIVYASSRDRKPWREHDDFTVLWEQPAGCVVAHVRKHGDIVDAIDFDVRKEV